MFEDLSPPYGTIVADPPWMYQKKPGAKQDGSNHGATKRMAEHIYSTMTNEELAALPVADLAADDAHLYLWITNPGIYGGRFSDVTPRDIAEAWGFEFKTMLTWVKGGAPGMGFYFRGHTEHVLFCTRGHAPIPPESRVRNVFESPRRGHSEKPAVFMDLVEQVSPAPRLELFCRAPRFGWDSWGYGYENVLETA